jgi:dynein heavy chain 1
VALKTALQSYAAARGLITPELEPLVARELHAIQESITEAFDASSGRSKSSTKRRIRWDSKGLADWIAILNEHVAQFEERVEILLRACYKINIAIEAMDNIIYDRQKFRIAVENVQKIVDELSMAGFPDLSTWVGKVNKKMGVALGNRLEEALHAWSDTFLSKDPSSGKISKTARRKNLVRIPKISVEILLRNQEISAAPAVSCTRSIFLNELHDYMGIVCNLPCLNSGRFEVFESKSYGGKAAETFYYLVNSVSPETLSDAYCSVESHIRNLSQFVDQWLAYQSLWDSQVSDVASAVNGDLKKWHDLIVEASAARATLDASSTVAEFGPILVKYNKVQSQVNLKYDSWQKELQTYFASILAERIGVSYEMLSTAKARLESISLEGSSAATNEIVLGVTFLQDMTHQYLSWQLNVKEIATSEKVLKRQRHVFRGDWVEASLVGGLLQQIEQLLSKKSTTMQEQVPLLQSRIIAEDKATSQRVMDLINDWEQNKPLMGNVTPDQAIETLTKFEFNIKKAQLDQENLSKAKDALGMDVGPGSDEIARCLDEVFDLTEVWEAVSKPYTALLEIKDTLWATAVMRKVRKTLDDLLIELRSLPNKIRQYDACTSLYDKIKSFIGGHSTLSDLKTGALKDRHWKTILQKLNVHVSFSELTVGMLWDNGLLERKKEFAEILQTAQGEMAIENFLNEIRDRWMKQELDLVLYQNRVRLIRGWDDLFTTLDDHTGGLVLMRSSPYYRSVREFQEDGNLWEDRLTKLRSAFDSWIDVQRRWVYLEGIFLGGADIKAQLPAEWSRFKNVDGEFIALMRRISTRPYAMEALNIENLQRTLERLANLMNVIQKALGAYLSKQRSELSRFYFLGDDDLLEIIGNSSEPGKVLPHLGKMFASIATCNSVPSEEEGVLTVFDAMISKEGEKVPLDSVITVTNKTNVKDWLKDLENGMHTTLAKLLNDAVFEVQSAQAKSEFVQWAGKFPAQVMILASLVEWSMSMDAALRHADSHKQLQIVLGGIHEKLDVIAETVLLDLPSESRRKYEQLITELVHQRDVTRSMIDGGVSDVNDFRWLYHLRFNFNPQAENLIEKLHISLSNASFYYGFEYLGIGERLVQTPLTDRCYLTLTQALHFRMGKCRISLFSRPSYSLNNAELRTLSNRW